MICDGEKRNPTTAFLGLKITGLKLKIARVLDRDPLCSVKLVLNHHPP